MKEKNVKINNFIIFAYFIKVFKENHILLKIS